MKALAFCIRLIITMSILVNVPVDLDGNHWKVVTIITSIAFGINILLDLYVWATNRSNL